MPGWKDLNTLFQKNKILVENFSFLGMMQVANLILFLVTVPYLFRALGKETYGLVIFAQTVVLYFSILVNFGFNLTAARDVSVNRNTPVRLNEIVTSVLIIKVIFFISAVMIMYLLTSLIESFHQFRILYLFSMIAALSEALFPVWYFQGIEKMKYITFINVSTRIISTVLVFIFITGTSDYIKYPLIIGAGSLTGAIVGLIIVFGKHGVKFIYIPVADLVDKIKENTLYFLANVSTQVYVNANRIIVGAFLGMTQVAYYDVAEKIVTILKVPFSVLNQVLLPRFAKTLNYSFLRKIMLATISSTLIVIIGLNFFSMPVMRIFTGSSNIESVNILRLLSISLLPVAVSIFYGDIVLISYELKKEYASMRFSGLLLYLAMTAIIVLTGHASSYYIAATIVVVEIFIACCSYMLCRKSNLLHEHFF